MACRIIDLSLSGAAVAVENKPEIGTVLSLGRVRGRVVRHIEGGIAIEFATVQSATTSTPKSLQTNTTPSSERSIPESLIS